MKATEGYPAEQRYVQDNVHAKRRLFACYLTIFYPGCMQKRGSSHSEQNHASIHHWVGEHFYDDLVHQLHRMLERQRDMALEQSQRESQELFKFPVHVGQVQKHYPKDAKCIGYAAQALSRWAFDMFVEEVAVYRNYTVYTDSGVPYVRYQKNNDGQPRSMVGRC